MTDSYDLLERMCNLPGAIHQSRGGVLTGIVSVPCRYIHSPFSTCLLSDFDHTWRLLAASVRAAPEV